MTETSAAQSEESRAFLQQRLATCAAWGAFMLAVLLATRIGFAIMRAPDRLTSVSYAANLGAVIVPGACALITRRGALPHRTLRALDASSFLLLSAMIVASCLDMSQVRSPHHNMLLALSLGLVARAIFVPSSGRLTFTIGCGVGLAAGVGAWVAYMEPEPRFLAAVDAALPTGFRSELSLRATVETLAWWAGVLAVATGTSRVIYGLREEVREAQKLGQYTLLERLGQGGMGVVYRARHALLRRPTAIKLLIAGRGSEEQLTRFEREVQLTAGLTHPNTITVFDYGRTPDGVLYYAMELLDGANLEDVVEASGPQPPERVAHVLRGCAGALAEAHEVGLVHRDVKPQNIMLCRQGGLVDVPKLLDFGLVKELDAEVSQSLSTAGTIVGTPLYMAPENISGTAEPDHRVDLYALGAVGYFLLTGQHVFGGKNTVEVCIAHLQEQPIPPSERLDTPTHPGLERLLMACLSKDPNGRPPSAEAVLDQLDALTDIGPWDGAWWWDEYGDLLRSSPTGPGSAAGQTLAVDVVDRTVPAARSPAGT